MCASELQVCVCGEGQKGENLEQTALFAESSVGPDAGLPLSGITLMTLRSEIMT